MIDKKATQISELEKNTVEAAISKAEKNTSAEIFAVLAQRSDDYRFIAYGILALWIFIVSGLLAVYLEWQSVIGWGDVDALAKVPVSYFLWAQLLAFLCGIALLKYVPSLVKMLVPERIAHERAHANAVKQFLAHGIHHTDKRTGVLIFISLQEQYGEIIVDRLIEEKIGRDYFLENVGIMLAQCELGNIGKAFEITIGEIGNKLANDFPRSENDRNELADKLIVM